MKHTALAVALGLSFGLAPAASAHHDGTCYISKNGTHICYVRMGKQTFAAAVTDGATVKPTVIAVHCTNGWDGAGVLSKDTMFMIAMAICSDHDLPESAAVTVSY